MTSVPRPAGSTDRPPPTRAQSGIQPLSHADLEAVVGLYRRHLARPHVADHGEIVAAFARIFLDGPATDPQIPSLVYRGRDGAVLGFVGALVWPMRFGDTVVRMVCSSSLVVDPHARVPGVGALLMRRLLAGPQDLTMTDTSTPDGQRLWTALGGDAWPLASITWLLPLRPVATAVELGAPRVHAQRWRPLLRRIAVPVDRLLLRMGPLRPTPTTTTLTERPLSAADVAADAARADGSRLRPVHEAPDVAWVLDEMGAARSKGTLHAHVVSDGDTTVGWHLGFLLPTGIWQVLHLAPRPGHAARLLEHVTGRARALGAAAIKGRVTDAIFTALPTRTAMYSTVRFLYHSRHPEIARAISAGDALFTGLDGDMWLPT